MGMLNYAATISLDGYIADSAGDFQWAAPTEDVFALHLERLSGVTTEILGRRTYHLMQYWEDPAQRAEMTEPELNFAQYWQDVKKIVVSSTLAASELRSHRDHLQRDLCLADIRRIVAATDGVVEIFGPTTAAEAIRACLVDQFEFSSSRSCLVADVKLYPTERIANSSSRIPGRLRTAPCTCDTGASGQHLRFCATTLRRGLPCLRRRQSPRCGTVLSPGCLPPLTSSNRANPGTARRVGWRALKPDQYLGGDTTAPPIR